MSHTALCFAFGVMLTGYERPITNGVICPRSARLQWQLRISHGDSPVPALAVQLRQRIAARLDD
ncbi:hypothetical protein ACKU5B_028030 [Klebsiella pneumoniae]